MKNLNRLREDVAKMKDDETRGALLHMLDVMEEYYDNEFVQRLINHYWQGSCTKKHDEA